MRTFSIAVLPGDGIGQDVTEQAVHALEALRPAMPDVRLELAWHDVGAGAFQRIGDPFSPAAFDACRRADAVLLGAMGLPGVRWPDGREMAPQLDLREKLDLYCGLRPIKLYHPSDCQVRLPAGATIDMLLVRENTEGLFVDREKTVAPHAEAVDDRLRITRRGATRICEAAFRQARLRRGRVALVDKANVLPSMVFLRRIFLEVAREFPDVHAECLYVDAAALHLVRAPHRFDVLVTENMFGDILSDLMAGLVGGMGMAPSADIGAETAVFQPSHGSAPDIAGQGLANPIATILSAAMMLDWLDHPETKNAARLLNEAVVYTLSDPGRRTPDMGGTMSTAAMGRFIASRIGEKLGMADVA
jgi:3-isopropylmalate dehydrogenase